MKKKIQKTVPFLVLLAVATAFFTLRKLAPEQLFLENWLPFYGIAILVVLPVLMVVFPNLNKLVNKFLGEKHLVIQGFAFVLPMMGMMFTLMTGLSIYVMKPYDSVQEFFQLFGDELIKNIPLFIAVALLMGGVVRPLITKRKQRLSEAK